MWSSDSQAQAEAASCTQPLPLLRNICSVEHCQANQYVLVLYCMQSYPLTPLQQGLIKRPSTRHIVPRMCNVLNKYRH